MLLKIALLAYLLTRLTHGLEVADIDKANVEYLKMADKGYFGKLDVEKSKDEKLGNMDYVSVPIEIPIEGGRPDKSGYMKIKINTTMFDKQMVRIEKSYRSWGSWSAFIFDSEGLDTLNEIVPDFIWHLVGAAKRQVLKFLPTYLIPDYNEELRENVQKARVRYDELKNAVNNLKVVKSPVKKDEVVIDVKFNNYEFYKNDYEPHFSRFLKSEDAYEKFLARIRMTSGAILHMTKCLNEGIFMLPVMNKQLAVKLIVEGMRILLQDKEYESLAEKLLLNAYEMSVIGIEAGIIEVLLEVPLRHKKNVQDSKVI